MLFAEWSLRLRLQRLYSVEQIFRLRIVNVKDHRLLLFCALPSIVLLATVSACGQPSMCAPVSNNPLVIENLCTPYSESKIVPAVATAPALLVLTADEFSGIKLDDPPTIVPGDELVFEANRRDFVLHTQLSNGQEIVTGPLSRADATIHPWLGEKDVCGWIIQTSSARRSLNTG
jgi:hypothetical protein